MQLTDVQTKAVSEWVRAGAGLSEIQRRLGVEFGLKLTYMDVRFLLIDLGLDLKQAAEERKAPPAAPPPLPPDELAEEDLGEEPAPVLEPEHVPPASGVKVDVDRITRPGTVVSGNVVFSDGNKAQWAIDQMGRLALMPEVKSYRPPASDIQAFQQAIHSQLQKMGY